MTPEERIDHDNAREFAKQYERNYPSGGRIENLAMCYLALLTEHSARDLLRRLVAQGYVLKLPDDLSAKVQRVLALPATESAQPEPERYVGSPAPPLPQRAERKEEPDMKSLVAWFVQTKLGQKLIGWLFRGTEDM